MLRPHCPCSSCPVHDSTRSTRTSSANHVCHIARSQQQSGHSLRNIQSLLWRCPPSGFGSGPCARIRSRQWSRTGGIHRDELNRNLLHEEARLWSSHGGMHISHLLIPGLPHVGGRPTISTDGSLQLSPRRIRGAHSPGRTKLLGGLPASNRRGNQPRQVLLVPSGLQVDRNPVGLPIHGGDARRSASPKPFRRRAALESI